VVHWLRLIVWFAIGMRDLISAYGVRHSRLAQPGAGDRRQGCEMTRRRGNDRTKGNSR